jgi:hypothetical protein
MSGRSRAVLRGERLEAREVPTAAPIFAVGAGPGGGPRVQVFDTATGGQLADFFAYEPSFTGGVTTAVADVNSDGRPDVIVGAGDGGAPRIRVFDGRAFDRTVTPALTANAVNPPVVADFFAYESSFRNGVFVGGGNVLGLGFAEVVAGAGPGGGPRVRVFDGQRMTAAGTAFTGAAPLDVLADFFAYDPNSRGGVRVALTPPLGVALGPGNLVTAPGPGVAPEIRVFNGFSLASQQTRFTGVQPGDVLNDFFDGRADDLSGRFVAAGDVSRDGTPDVITGTGAGVAARVTAYDGSTLRARGLAFSGLLTGDIFDTFAPLAADPAYQNGVTVGAATLPAGVGANLLTGIGGAGRLGEAFGYQYTPFATAVRQLVFDQVFDPTFTGGVLVGT